MSFDDSLLGKKNSLQHTVAGNFDNLHDDSTSCKAHRFNQEISLIKSLRSRGYIFNGIVLVLLVLITFFFFSQREQSLDQLAQYQEIQQTQETLLKADLVAFHVVTVLFSEVTQTELTQVVTYFSTLKQHYQKLVLLFPQEADTFRKLEQSLPLSLDQPGELYLQKVHLYLAQSKNEIDRLIIANQDRMTRLVKDNRQQNDALILKTLILGTIGLILIGSLTTLFFNQLKSDILNLCQRTIEIVNGYRGNPLPVNRQDELGQLTDGINFMSQALANREKDLEIARRKSSFHEKMIAIDSLAGGLAHEVGNSVACISGLTDEISSDNNNQLSKASLKNLKLLQHHAEDLATLSQNLSLIDTQFPDKNEWVDINQLLASIANLIRFDQRWASIKIELDLDRQLPAIYFSATQFNQLMAHLFENALDALSNRINPQILIRTKSGNDDLITIVFQDNGEGVTESDLSHIFEPFFTTKPLGQGTGLGLAICWTIIRALNGNIQADSSEEGGLRLTMSLPVNNTVKQEA